MSNIWKQLISILSKLNIFHSLEVVDRVSDAQLQVSENTNWIISLVEKNESGLRPPLCTYRLNWARRMRDTTSSGWKFRLNNLAAKELMNFHELITVVFYLIRHLSTCRSIGLPNGQGGAQVQSLKLPAWEVGDRRFEPHSGIQVS